MDDNKAKALAAALQQIEKQFGKGSIMKMGDAEIDEGIQVVSTGSLGLDIALGVGGLPRGRVVEIYGPESSGKTTLCLQVVAEMQKLGIVGQESVTQLGAMLQVQMKVTGSADEAANNLKNWMSKIGSGETVKNYKDAGIDYEASMKTNIGKGWSTLEASLGIAKDYIEGLNMLANMRMCSNVPAQSVVQTALGGHQSVNDYIVPGGRLYEQREYIYNALNSIPGVTAVKPKAAFYIFPKIDVKRFNIHSDEQFALDLLHDKHILISHGGAFNWHRPDHFRVVYLPRMGMLRETMGEISDFFSYYWQS